MDKVYVIIGIGPNSVEVPCRIFKTKDDAQKFLDTNPPIEDLFTFYSDGCGECDDLEIREVKFNSVFVGWDLD